MGDALRSGAGSLLLALAACSVKPTTFTPLGDDGSGNDGGSNGNDGGNAAPGQALWARSLSTMSGYRVRSGPTGLVVAGSFFAPVTLGGATYTPVATSSDMVFAQVDPATGEITGSAHDGGPGYEAAFVETLDASGTPILHGITSDQCDIGTGLMPGGGGSDTFIGRYPGAVPSWSYRLATAEEDKIIATGPGPDNTVYATGYFVGTATIGTHQLVGRGGRDVMLWAFDATTGAVKTAVSYGSTGRDEGATVIGTASGAVLGGIFEGSIQLGQIALTGAGGLDAFVGKLTASDSFAWARAIGGAGNELGPELGVDAAGDVYVTGTYQGQLVLDAAHVLNSAGGTDLYVVKLGGEDGHVMWASSIGSPGEENMFGIAVAPNGRIVVAGTATGALDVGIGNNGGLDAFFVSFETDGSVRWNHGYGSAGDDRAWSVTYAADGMVYATVTLAGAVDLGVPLDGPADPVGVLLKLAP